LTKLCFRSLPFVDEACVLKRRRGVIRSHGKQQLVDLGRKVGAITRRSEKSLKRVGRHAEELGLKNESVQDAGT